ncbi:glycogen/starch/alpha-glucan phosphorylase [Geotalea uraniireducens]|uniref:Alpha-1,4 glucan phosphorylase n=1 Tax=Geotalea uraniireducens (strain Rf4) TaxID=351605 RepID=A5G886_GEOUR|nr:glycogen/starch/alpha-glucan phosphorylase [Geotalea uraniireducens]ABQ28004.1 glycogen/starch/alpha-glucan phosphorylase [Geotalea uraniireducens Rf4]
MENQDEVSTGEKCRNIRTGSSPDDIAQAFLDNLYYAQGRIPVLATRNDLYMALAYTVRDRLAARWVAQMQQFRRAELKKSIKVVCYLSAEFLPGPHLGNNLLNLGIYDETRQAMEQLGYNLEELIDQETEPGLGNGGLGRLASCFMDSLSTIVVPAFGYGIRYEFGIFDQEIRDGWQVEITDKWLKLGNPWEMPLPELCQEVKLGGHTEHYQDGQGRSRVRWIPAGVVEGIPYDTPILGYGGNICNTLRLWKAEAVESFDFQDFNVGNYYAAVEEKVKSETITKVLYPNDEPEIGKMLRLIQEYFFVSCSLQDMIRIGKMLGNSPECFDQRYVAQLNDTHPSIAVAELMRLLVDEHDVAWEKAWEITQNTFGYTNHTLLPEALEKWPVELFGQILPRHLEIVYEINRRFLDQVRLAFPGDEEQAARLSLIDESGCRYVRMAHLACVGCHAVNGVAKLHSELLKSEVLRDFHEMFPEKFHNVTNGVTPRRWMALSNPRLAALISGVIGDGWITQLDELRKLEPFADDPAFQEKWRRVKRENKNDLATLILNRTGVAVDPDSLFDIQVKRLHEYKRQHLNVLHIITLYARLKRYPASDCVPRTFVFGGKAAPGYAMAKLIIKLINSVAGVVNTDPDIRGRLNVAFLPDFNVKTGQQVYPAADLSEQISLAGEEASGTGNMKFSMNGALTIGTLDGANVEIREEVGAENFFLFGLKVDEVEELKARGYDPRKYYDSNPALREAIDLIRSGHFSGGNAQLFAPLVDLLMQRDNYMLFADYQPYIDCQDRVSAAFRDQQNWTRMSILNVARMGKFSSDRAVREYCDMIWKVQPV